jgi:hypothetical protein
VGKVDFSYLRENAIMKIQSHIRLVIIVLAGVILVLATPPAFSQNCALCYTQAAAAGARMIQALRSGILILIVPPTLGTIGMIFLVHHKRNQFRDPNSEAEFDSQEIGQRTSDSAEE